jgi:hypothetical protein
VFILMRSMVFRYRVVLCSDSKEFGGFGRIDVEKTQPIAEDIPWQTRPCSIIVYSPSRTVIVMAAMD